MLSMLPLQREDSPSHGVTSGDARPSLTFRAPAWVVRAAFVALDRAGMDDGPARLHAAADAWRWAHEKHSEVVLRFEYRGREYVVLEGPLPRASSPARLTQRERDVVRFVASGRSNKFAAFELGISQSAVAMRLQSAMRKLGVADRVALIRLVSAERSSAVDVLAHVDAPARDRTWKSIQGIANAPAPPPGLLATRFSLHDAEFLLLSYPTSTPDAIALLTPAERDVAHRILSGSSNAEIAEQRSSSVRTVACQVRAIFRKLGLASRSELVARCALCTSGTTQDVGTRAC